MKIQTMRAGIFGMLLGFIRARLVNSRCARAGTDIYWFCRQGCVLLYLYIWYRGTFPRYRFDQLMKVGWKVLLPTGLAVLIATAVWGLMPQLSSAILGVLR